MTVTAVALTSCCGASKSEAPWIVDRFDDIKVIRYEVPGFEQLPLAEKELVYYLAEAAKCGRDILFDQNFKYNLAVRRTLETVYENYRGDRSAAEWKALEKYLKKVWFANGIHHHYSNDKFVPEFTEGYLLDVIETIPEEKFGDLNPLRGEVCKAIFDPALYKTRLNQTAGEDLIATSSNNYYEGVTQAEVEKFYADMVDHNDPEPISYGLNSKLVKENGVLKERVWKVGGMYSPAIEKIVYWLEKAQAVATEPQKSNIAALIEYYKTGDLREFDRYNIVWVKDTVQHRQPLLAIQHLCQCAHGLKVIQGIQHDPGKTCFCLLAVLCFNGQHQEFCLDHAVVAVFQLPAEHIRVEGAYRVELVLLRRDLNSFAKIRFVHLAANKG